jgi:hypothetical protein
MVISIVIRLSVGTAEVCWPSCQNGELSWDVGYSHTFVLLQESQYVQLCYQSLNELHFILYNFTSYFVPRVLSLLFGT